ncbi:MAG: class I SAM-dependent methyltransferase [Planctomycetes bacterium]|nr:class I SAM-dependent methyltransferase [Planctomycetota bacterium]
MPLIKSLKSHRRKKRGEWQHVSLVAGFLAGRHFVGTNDLHYGFWVNGIEPQIRNLPRAQEEYSRFLLEHIPSDAKRILDVGCGAGGLAAKLVERGHYVDCVSPNAFLNQQAKELLGDRARLFDCKYEDYRTSDVYDAIVFCESYQYVNMPKGLDLVTSQLRSGGSLVICDFFRLPLKEKSPISGGHYIDEFQQIVAGYPLTLVEDIDITLQTAPTFTVIDSAFTDVLRPIWDEIGHASVATHPYWSKLAAWFFRRRLAKVKDKYFTHTRSAANFEKFKTYRLMRYVRD